MRSDLLLGATLGLLLTVGMSASLYTVHGTKILVSEESVDSQCKECHGFIPKLMDIASKGYTVSYDGESGDTPEALCMKHMPRHLQTACIRVGRKFGFHQVDAIAKDSVDALCAELAACNGLALGQNDLLVEAEEGEAQTMAESETADALANLSEGALDDDEDDDSDSDDYAADETDDDGDADDDSEEVELSTDSARMNRRRRRRRRTRRTRRRRTNKKGKKGGKKAKKKTRRAPRRKAARKAAKKKSAGSNPAANTQQHVHAMVNSMMKMMQQRQIMQMQMQQQQMMQMQIMRMRMMGIMASNREMKTRMRHIRRHMPGNCDCCQSCPPPPNFVVKA